MKLTNIGTILSIIRRDEKSAIVTALTKNHGLYSGYTSIKKFTSLQVGNIFQISWSARLSSHLGNINFELLESISAFFLHDYHKMLALSVVTKTLAKILPEREPQQEIFNALYRLLLSLKNSANWKISYLRLELVILKKLGFELDLRKCPVTNSTDNLKFISPKTGRAISYTAGKAYQDKLLTLPMVLYAIHNNMEENGDIEEQFGQCLKVTNYFLNKHCFHSCNIKIPYERELLYKVFSTT